MLNSGKEYIKEMVKELALSFFFVSFFIVLIHFFFGEKIDFVVSLISKITIEEKIGETKELDFDPVKKRLKSYPAYGTIYAILKIPSIELELSVYHGDTLELLRYGVGHYAGSYFPGEGASIVFAAHNDGRYFMRIPEIPIGEKVIIETLYGTFEYLVIDKKIILETDTASIPIQTDEEILMMYTCYPVNSLGHKKERYVVYAKKVSETYAS